MIRQGKASVSGSLDKDIIRRIIRAHINEVRSCYNAGLTKDPALAGKLVVRFELGADGKVTSAEIVDDQLGDATVGACVAKALRRWTFPKSEGGIVVSYPFEFSPS
jgi:TonB family protein